MKLKYITVFLFGFLACAGLFSLFGYFSEEITEFSKEIPFGTGLIGLDDVVTPSDRISEDNIIIFDNMVVLEIPNATLSNYADSGSMSPFLDKGANGIRIVPNSEDEIEVGDIVSYRFGKMLVVHRVIEKGVDNKGIYFIVQGDNNLMSDGKIRFEDIEYITVGIIY